MDIGIDIGARTSCAGRRRVSCMSRNSCCSGSGTRAGTSTSVGTEGRTRLRSLHRSRWRRTSASRVDSWPGCGIGIEVGTRPGVRVPKARHVVFVVVE